MKPHQQQQQDDEDNDDDNNDNNNNNSPCPSCPSFSSYTNNTHISEIAINMSNPDNNDDDFEFDLSGHTSSDSTQVYPVFNRDLLRDLGSDNMIELRKLFFQEDMNNNNNDDDIDMILSEELEGVSPETYCLWAPKSPETPSPSRCMKSSSTGSGPSVGVSKAWRLRNLLRRCKSDGKEGLMLVTNGKVKLSPPPSPGWGGGKEAAVRRRKSYLPYKQELLGFFGSNQTLRNINIPPF